MTSANIEPTMAAVASGSSLSAPPNVAADFVRPDFHQVQLDVEAYLKNEKGMKLDAGELTPLNALTADAQICRLALLPLGCPLGPLVCPLRHTAPAPSNFQPPPSLPNNPRDREKKTTVCKHYLRNLCKMGDNCVYTHDFNLRTMPECVWFKKLGKCELGGECLYFHPRGMSRRVECPDYNRGFCPSGE